MGLACCCAKPSYDNLDKGGDANAEPAAVDSVLSPEAWHRMTIKGVVDRINEATRCAAVTGHSSTTLWFDNKKDCDLAVSTMVAARYVVHPVVSGSVGGRHVKYEWGAGMAAASPPSYLEDEIYKTTPDSSTRSYRT
jgi:hypothetical protein